MKIVVLILGTIVLTLGTALADNPKQSQWTPPFIFNGGINIMSDKGQLDPNQLLSASNFIWRNNQLKVREGFLRYVAPLSSVGLEFIDVFSNTSGESYLFYSNGQRLWVSTGLTAAPFEISLGYVNVGTVDTYGAEVHGNNPTTQKWLTSLGSGEGVAITINSTAYTISKVITDTSLLLTTSAGNQSAQNYAISNNGISGISSFQLADKYWLYANIGRLSFTNPSSYTVRDTLNGARYLSTSVSRQCGPFGHPSLKFNAPTGHGRSAGQFLRIVLNPKSDTAASVNPLPAGHHYYTQFPIMAANDSILWTSNSAFPPDDTLDGFLGANYLTLDTASEEIILLDSAVVVTLGELSCAPYIDSSRYLKLYKSSWTDTAQFITGDWFVSPMITEATYGNSFTAGGIRPQVEDTIEFSRIYLGKAPNKINGASVKFYSLAPVTGLIKIAIYNNDSTLIDTSYTKSVTDLYQTDVSFTFTKTIDVSAEWGWLAVTSNITGLYMYARISTGWRQTKMLRTYDGGFPTTLTAGAYGVTTNRECSFKVSYTNYDSTVNSATAYNNCLPVIGGYLDTANNFIYVGVANEGMPTPARWPALMADPDTVKMMFFRMKKNVVVTNIYGYRFATIFQDRTFTAKDTTCNQIEWSEPFLPDSTISTSVMVINSGDGECITGAMTQFADLVVYQPNSRWKVYGDGTNAGYAREKMAGSVGCVAKGSLLKVDGNHYFLHSTGYYMSGGDVPTLISANINSYFTDSINTNRYNLVASGYDQERGNIWISFPNGVSLVNNVTLVYNVATQSWWRESIDVGAYCYNPDYTVSDSVRFMIGKTDSSTILFRGGGYDDGAEIDAHVQTGYMDFGEPNNYKRIEKFHLRHHTAERDSITYWVYSDTISTPVSTISYIPHRYSWTDRKIGLPDATVLGERLSSKWMFYNAGMMTLPFISLKLWLGDESEGVMDDEIVDPTTQSAPLGDPIQ